MTKWTDFAKAYAKKHNISYKEALSKCKDEYSKSKTECMKKSKKTIKGGRISNALLLLPDLAFVNVLESVGNWADLQSMAVTFQTIINEGGLTEEELLLVTNRLELVNDQIEALRRKPSPPPTKRNDSPPSPPRKGKRGGDDFSFSFGGVNKKIK